MVGTRLKNKTVHPAAPVMSNAAKIRAGVPAKRQNKKVTKDKKICLLEARLTAFENPDDTVDISKDPLVSRLMTCLMLADIYDPVLKR